MSAARQLSIEELEARVCAEPSPEALAANEELLALDADAREAENSSVNLYAKYFDDPVGFFVDVLGINPWSKQEALIRAVAVHPRLACRSGHKAGKSISTVGLGLWWLCTRPRAKVVMTAPSAEQVKDILWLELGKWFPKVAHALGDPELPKDPSTGIVLKDGRTMKGRTSNKPERMAGTSGDQILFIIDEASGYEDDLYEPIEGNTAGGAHIVAISNPTRTVGWFFKAFKNGTTDLSPPPPCDAPHGSPEWDEAEEERQRYRLLHISSEETPNVTNPDTSTHVPGLATRAYLLKMRKDCGPDWENDATYLVRVRGEFPGQATDAVIGHRYVSQGTQRWKLRDATLATLPLAGQLSLGVDVARFGSDETVIQPERDGFAWRSTIVSNADGPTVATEVVRIAKLLRKSDMDRVRVCVDGIGVGASVIDALRKDDLTHRGQLQIVDVCVSVEADDPDHHTLRSQLWFGMATWLKEGGRIPDDNRLTEEMLAATYTFDPRGRKKVSSKKDIRKLIKRSPDRADALALAVYRGQGRVYDYQAAPKVEENGGRGGYRSRRRRRGGVY